MKKTLLTLLIITGVSFGYSQILQQDNFNTLTIGNVGTDITGTTPGQGSWLTFVGSGSTNSNNSNFQIYSEGGAYGNALEMTGSNTASGTRFMWKDGLTSSWASRTVGNNIIEVEFDYFTGGTTSSNNSFRVYIYSDEATPKVLAGIGITRNLTVSSVPYTNVVQGFGHWTSTPGTGTYSFGLGPNATTPYTLPANTWVRIGVAFNVTTGHIRWKSSHNNLNATFSGDTTFPVVTNGINPGEVDFLVVAGTANATASTGRFDNFVVRASSTDTLLSVDEVVSIENAVSIYPNPIENSFQIQTNGFVVNSVNIFDINGRNIKSFQNTNNFDITELPSGIYFVEISNDEMKTTQKIIKK